MPNHAGSRTILVVDDDPGMLESLTDILAAAGYSVESASSGTEALAIAKKNAPDLVVMDVKMPGPDGVETFRRLKMVAPESLVVLMTAYSSSELVKEALDEGALRVFPKPLDLEGLLRLIESTSSRIHGHRSFS